MSRGGIGEELLMVGRREHKTLQSRAYRRRLQNLLNLTACWRSIKIGDGQKKGYEKKALELLMESLWRHPHAMLQLVTNGF